MSFLPISHDLRAMLADTEARRKWNELASGAPMNPRRDRGDRETDTRWPHTLRCNDPLASQFLAD
jgi:hypothetical protein